MGILGKLFGGGKPKPAELDDTTLPAAVEVSREKPVLIQFYSVTCAPCRVMSGVVRELSGEMGDQAAFYKADVAYTPQHSAKFAIRSVPTVLIFSRGRLVNRIVGLQPLDDLRKRMQAYIKK